jgi:hypothetical protein
MRPKLCFALLCFALLCCKYEIEVHRLGEEEEMGDGALETERMTGKFHESGNGALRLAWSSATREERTHLPWRTELRQSKRHFFEALNWLSVRLM